MVFNEVLEFPDISPVAESSIATTKCTSPFRFDTAPYDEQQARDDMPVLAPVSPSPSLARESSSASTSAADIEDKYHIDPRVLGTGYHGSVRECINRTSGERLAVKSIRKSDPSVKPGNLAREIMLLQEVNHESIIRLVDVYEDDEYVHLVTDLCEGGELFDKIVENASRDNGMPCFAEADAANVLYQILSAVSYMHKHGIVHRDIKPENILFTTTDDEENSQSTVKIIDFGLARKHHGISFGEQPMSTIVGTPYYISPDVLKKRYDKSCDLWSVGVIAYILMCGYPPFNGANNCEVYDAVRRGRYQFSSADWSATSKESRDFIRRLLQRDPAKRMTAEEALNHPWIVQHADNDDVMLIDDDDDVESSSVEVVFHGLPSRRDSIICGGSPQRQIRRRLFVC